MIKLNKWALSFMTMLLVSTGGQAADVKSSKPLEHVPNRSFYKDVFFDCGIGLTSRDTLPAVKMLGLSIERVAYDEMSDASEQNKFIAGDDSDWNGRLLYPDGEPRFKMIFIDGGSSLTHGTSLGEAGRRRIREFYNAGGSYVGTCAGAILASQGFDGNPNVPNYLHIWPAPFCHTEKAKIYTGMFIENKSPLLKYYDFGGDKYIAEVRHNQGNFPGDMPKGAEVLARYDYKEGGKMHNKPSVSAYKKDNITGRMVLCGSHPEEVTEGERRDLAAGMIKYALDGIGMTKVKGYLKNGESRVMDRQSYERQPEFTRIGDLQVHHFAVEIPQGARDVTFNLDGPEGTHFTLAVCKDTYAYDDVADFVSTIEGAKHQFTLPKMKAGLWYVAVKCLDCPEAVNTATGHIYKNTEVKDLLNGVPYTVKVSWK